MKEFLHSAVGKVRTKKNLLHPSTKTVQLQTGIESGYLALDIDDPKHENNKKLLDLISKEDFIVYSSQYTLEDVFNGKCRYKVIYYYPNGKHIPNKKTNKAIEIFYQKARWVAIAGKRDDGYEYNFNGKVSSIHFDVNDILETPVPFDLLGGGTPTTPSVKGTTTPTVEIDVESEDVDIDEYKSLVGMFVDELPVIKQKNNTLLVFECLFPHTHKKKNYAYAFKKNGIYITHCQGEVCSLEYQELNKKVQEYLLNKVSFENVDGFGVTKDDVSVFLAPTGWGKTEKIAEEALLAVNNNKKLLILLQNKEAIERLLDRINFKSNGALKQLEEFKKIYVYTSENKDENFKDDVNMANVIISHHYYFKNAGEVLTYFPSSHYILGLRNLEVIVDEAHSYIELASRLDLEIGGLYALKTYNGVDIFMHNNVQMTREQVLDNPLMANLTKCLEPKMSDFGTISLQKQYKVYKDIEYLDVFSELKKKFKLINTFTQDFYTYYVFKNENIEPMKANSLEEVDNAIDLLLNPAEYAVIGTNNGDDVKRRQIGNVTLTIYHSQNLQQILHKPKKVMLTTATMNKYHYEILDRYCDYEVIEIEEEIEKINKIILLKSQDNKASRIRNKVLETVNDLNSRSLIFFPTISKAKTALSKYNNCMLNDNGFYVIGKRHDENDFVDNVQRNVTLAGLESSVAKGYNYLEEVGATSAGFELIYFDNTPVSPQIVKKYINGKGELTDYENDYNISIFAQAIGRGLRKAKNTLTLAFNSVDDYTYDMIKKYLESYTNATIIEDTLNITNIKLGISSYVEQYDMAKLKNRFNRNELFKKIYLEEK